MAKVDIVINSRNGEIFCRQIEVIKRLADTMEELESKYCGPKEDYDSVVHKLEQSVFDLAVAIKEIPPYLFAPLDDYDFTPRR